MIIDAQIFTGDITAGTISEDDFIKDIRTTGNVRIAIKAKDVQNESQLNESYLTVQSTVSRYYKVADIKKEGAQWERVFETVTEQDFYVLELNNPLKQLVLRGITLTGDIQINEYPLTDIDNMREAILSTGRNQYTIDQDNEIEFLRNLTGRNEGKFKKTTDIEPGDWSNATPYTKLLNTTNVQYGLALKTYQSNLS